MNRPTRGFSSRNSRRPELASAFQRHDPTYFWPNDVQRPPQMNPPQRLDDYVVSEWFEQLPGPWVEPSWGPRPFEGHHGQHEPHYWHEGPGRAPEAAMNALPPDPHSHPPTNRERYELFKKMLMCGEKTFPTKTYLAIYWLKFEEPSGGEATLHSPLFENNPVGHAEEHLLTHLTLHLSVIDRRKLRSVTIMQNSSPCSSCADKYMQELGGLVRDAARVKVAIIFSSFHWVRRESCRRQRHNHQRISDDKHDGNVQALKQLRDAGFELRTTRYEDWKRLCAALQVPHHDVLPPHHDYLITPRGREDQNLHDDLQHVLQ